MKWLYLCAACLVLQACGGGESPAPEARSIEACAVADQRQSLRTFMQEQYYWYTNLGAANEGAGTMDAYFQSMLYRPTDRFSFTQPTADFTQLFTEGRRVGYGYVLVWSDASRTELRVRNVEPLSPVARAGLQRGDTVLAIDGHTAAEIALGLLPAVSTEGVERNFTIRTVAGEVRQFTVLSEDFALQPVLTSKVLDATRDSVPVKVGYLAYNQFVSYSLDGLRGAFAEFAAAGVGELILDLRYNGGGSVSVSRDLASMIGAGATADRLFAFLRFNDKQAAKTIRMLFTPPEVTGTPPLPGLRRVLVIASGGTASASELVINGLRPFMDVVLVGETTYGKPYGFVPRDSCGTTYQAVQFESLNSQGVGGYTAGFQPDCLVADDLDHALGDPQERRIQTALTYVATGRCSADAAVQRQAAPPRAPAPAFGETVPERMFLD